MDLHLMAPDLDSLGGTLSYFAPKSPISRSLPQCEISGTTTSPSPEPEMLAGDYHYYFGCPGEKNIRERAVTPGWTSSSSSSLLAAGFGDERWTNLGAPTSFQVQRTNGMI